MVFNIIFSIKLFAGTDTSKIPQAKHAGDISKISHTLNFQNFKYTRQVTGNPNLEKWLLPASFLAVLFCLVLSERI
jgi:hypothetical protein